MREFKVGDWIKCGCGGGRCSVRGPIIRVDGEEYRVHIWEARKPHEDWWADTIQLEHAEPFPKRRYLVLHYMKWLIRTRGEDV